MISITFSESLAVRGASFLGLARTFSSLNFDMPIAILFLKKGYFSLTLGKWFFHAGFGFRGNAFH